MTQDSGEKFRVFVSHKHDDHAFAVTVKKVLERLSGRIECFVSGSDLSAGTDWNIEIRSQLLKSHLLILLFTEPSRNWDWCLFEAGLFTSLGMADDHAVVCLYRPQGASPRPLSNLQGVPLEAGAVQAFLNTLCKETWRVAKEWRLGALFPRVPYGAIEKMSAEIIEAFPPGGVGDLIYYPCHRVVLDLSAIENVGATIPLEATVIEGESATSPYTLTLFNLAHGRRARVWRDLVEAAGGMGAQWLEDLDRRFAAALNEQLFSPSATMIQLWDPWRRHRRGYRPTLYQVVRDGRPQSLAGTGPAAGGRPLQITIVLEPMAEAADENRVSSL
jgi:TIR domain